MHFFPIYILIFIIGICYYLIENFWWFIVLVILLLLLLFGIFYLIAFKKEFKAYWHFRKITKEHPIPYNATVADRAYYQLRGLFDLWDSYEHTDAEKIISTLFYLHFQVDSIHNNVHKIENKIGYMEIMVQEKMEQSKDPEEIASYQDALKAIELLKSGVNARDLAEYLAGIKNDGILKQQDPEPLVLAYRSNDFAQIVEEQHKAIFSFIGFHKGKILRASTEKILLRLKWLVDEYDREKPSHVELYNFLFDVTNERRFTAKPKSAALEYLGCYYIILQLSIGKNFISIAESLQKDSEAFEEI